MTKLNSKQQHCGKSTIFSQLFLHSKLLNLFAIFFCLFVVHVLHHKISSALLREYQCVVIINHSGCVISALAFHYYLLVA